MVEKPSTTQQTIKFYLSKILLLAVILGEFSVSLGQLAGGLAWLRYE